ncbi:hypothetical protein ACPFUC_001907 [Vibrio cholerae]|jgi:hypothetical protein|uniref:hypothetical protein n=1 Tax=Vibrio fluvialis TaxID=676 RepID=UPI002572C02A|nr:hypothetical protein [Vibrio fluvialis]EGR4421483.1 hypothetical protein [Vibrio cholerae]BEI26593.1 hypothetical protein KKIDH5335_49250 [Vibrio fluvialis]
MNDFSLRLEELVNVAAVASDLLEKIDQLPVTMAVKQQEGAEDAAKIVFAPKNDTSGRTLELLIAQIDSEDRIGMVFLTAPQAPERLEFIEQSKLTPQLLETVMAGYFQPEITE